MSLSDPASAQPPYRPLLDWAAGLEGVRNFVAGLDLENLRHDLGDPSTARPFLTSLRIAALGTLLTLIVGYPIALAMARAPRSWRPLLMALVILPFWTSFLIRVYAWIAILKADGLLNQLLLAPRPCCHGRSTSSTARSRVQIGIVIATCPSWCCRALCRSGSEDPASSRRRRDLGCPPGRAFWLVTLPLSLPGIVGGSVLVFIPAMGEFIIPDLLGGSDTLMVGRPSGPSSSRTAMADGVGHRRPAARDPRGPHHLRPAPGGAAGGRPMRSRFTRTNLASLVLGLAFLYLPIASSSATASTPRASLRSWGGFSTQWYAGLCGTGR